MAILDADKEGFLRSETSLIQTIGRAARNAEGRVIMYADRITGSMERAISETNRRREKQQAYNELHGITPETVKKNVEDVLAGLYEGDVDMNRVTAKVDKPMVGANLMAHLDGLRARCARRPRTWNSKKPPACATRSTGWRRWSLRWPTTRWPGSPRWRRQASRRGGGLRLGSPDNGRGGGNGEGSTSEPAFFCVGQIARHFDASPDVF